MTKILLIRTMKITKDYFLVSPPLGLMYIASMLRESGNYEIGIKDMRLDKLGVEDIVKKFKEFQPDIIGLSVFTQEANLMHRIAGRIKEENPGCKIIVGGPHATSYPKEILEDLNIDYVVIGEGERTIVELVKSIEEGKNCNDIEGIVCREGKNIFLTKPRQRIENLDSVPFPAWDLIELKKYFRYPRFNNMAPGAYMSIFTSRGCPFHCIYCHNIFGKRYRTRSPENVLAEIKTLIEKYSIRDFEIIDDSFNLDMKRAKEICDLIIRENLNIKISFPNAIRGDIMDEELLYKLKRAGTYLLTYAIETGSPRLQRFIKKNINLFQIKWAISQTVKLGIFTHGFFILGFPTETKEEILKTIEFASQVDLHTATFFIANPYRGTELSRIARQMGKDVNIDFDNYSYAAANFNLSEVEDKEFFRLQRKAYRVFYLNMRRIFRILKSHPYKRGLLGYFFLFLKRAF